MRAQIAAKLGAIRIELGNLRLCRTAWWAREAYHSQVLPIA